MLLVPGFFGFANLGDFAYYKHVLEALEGRMRVHGVDGEVRVVATSPTASLARRAVKVLETLALLLDDQDGVVHLIGHSSGGLDLRVLLSPGSQLPTTIDAEKYLQRVVSAVTLSTPHRGSPLAGFLATLGLPQVLKLFSLVTIYTLRTGRVPLGAVFSLTRLLRLKRVPLLAGTLLDQIYRDLLSDFSLDRQQALDAFMVDVGTDQNLLVELAPSGMELLNGHLSDRPGVRYGSIVTSVPAPGMRSIAETGLHPFRQATHALFAAFHRITRNMPHERLQPPLDNAQVAALHKAYGRLPKLDDNDGMVPTLSQPWGEVVYAVEGDHLDTLGHFYEPKHVPPHFDWLNSGVAFTRSDFDLLWTEVARWLFD